MAAEVRAMPGFDIQEDMTMPENIIHTEWGDIRLPKRKEEKRLNNNVEYCVDEKGQIKKLNMAKARRK